ncbi:MAG: Fe-S cluster biosynthesis and repair protein YggX [Myxococcota bacterium]|jgi:Fe-S cluster biosynthesis and repair protein YggX
MSESETDTTTEPAVAMVQCKKLEREAPALTRQPWPGELGVRIKDQISAEAWAGWMEHAKMLINENRLNMGTDESQTFMREQMVAYLFAEGTSIAAEGFVPKID